MHSLLRLLPLLLTLAVTCRAEVYSLTEDVFAIGTDLTVVGHGKVIERVMHLTRHFDIEGDLPGASSEELLAWSTTYRVVDSQGRLLATVRKDAIRSLFKVMGSIYHITGPDGRELATSNRAGLIWPNVVVTEVNGAVSTLEATGWVYHTWVIHQGAHSQVDPRVLWIMAASLTAGSHQRGSH